MGVEIDQDHGVVLTGNGTVPFTFPDWINLVFGTSDFFDYESDNEGFALTGDGSLQWVFENWLNPNDGTSDTFDFESDNEGFSGTGDFCTIPYTFDDPMRTSTGCT